MSLAHLFATPLMRRVEHLGPWIGVTRPASNASATAVSAVQAARARRRRRDVPRTHYRTRVERGEMPGPKHPLDHERDVLPRHVRHNPRMRGNGLGILAAILQLASMAEREGRDVETFVRSIATMAVVCPRTVRNWLPVLETEGYVRTERLPGRSFRHRRLRVVVLDKARARPVPKRPRGQPAVVALAWRLLNSGDPRAADVLAGFHRRGRWVEEHRHVQQRAGFDLPTAEKRPASPGISTSRRS
jgi:hypothetical protein